MKKKRSLKARIRTWIFEKFLQRYLVSVDKRFIELFIKYDVKPLVIVESHAEREYKRIMKVLNSKKFKDYFYKVVKYDRSTAESLIKPYSDTLKDRIFSFIAKAYIYIFNREVHNDILLFQRIRDGIISMDKKVDEYMAKTTIEERLDKATSLGIISADNRKAQRRVRNIQKIRTDAIHQLNNVESNG
jgi:hypothetical protein